MEPLTASSSEPEVNNNQTLSEKQSVKGGELPSCDPSVRTITVTDPEQWICVAKLPPQTTQQTFQDLLADFGSVAECFLQQSAKTGLFKGYGFACFHNKVAALQARHVLEGQEVGGHTVDCGWLKEGSHKVSDLDSKVLFVDKLPPGFRDLAQFRKLFSSIVNPPYCQIAQKNGVLQDWGLVEYNTAQEAEDTMETLKNAKLDDIPVRIQYCIPNIHAINIYMSFVNNPMENRVEKKALMDSDCPSKDVYHQLQSLSKHNPSFVQSLQSIMTQNIIADDPPDGPTDQAVLALLLAAHLKPSQGLQQGAASLSSLVKQLEAGTSAVELLKTALASPGRQSGLLPSPGHSKSPDLSSLISSMTSLVSQGKLPAKVPPSPGPGTKNPQLMNMLYSAFQARMSKQQEESEAGPGPSPVPPPVPAEEAGPCYSLPSGYCGVYPGGQFQNYPPPPQPHDPAQPPAQPASSQNKNINQILAMPPPPPPPSPYTDQGWQYIQHPGQGLLFSPVIAPQVWPQHNPLQWNVQTTHKRKMEEYLPGQVPSYSDENQTVKRQKV